MDAAALDLQIDAVDGHKALELLGQGVGLQQDVVGHGGGECMATPGLDHAAAP